MLIQDQGIASMVHMVLFIWYVVPVSKTRGHTQGQFHRPSQLSLPIAKPFSITKLFNQQAFLTSRLEPTDQPLIHRLSPQTCKQACDHALPLPPKLHSGSLQPTYPQLDSPSSDITAVRCCITAAAIPWPSPKGQRTPAHPCSMTLR